MALLKDNPAKLRTTQFPADLVTFTEEIFIEKFHFCAVNRPIINTEQIMINPSLWTLNEWVIIMFSSKETIT